MTDIRCRNKKPTRLIDRMGLGRRQISARESLAVACHVFQEFSYRENADRRGIANHHRAQNAMVSGKQVAS